MKMQKIYLGLLVALLGTEAPAQDFNQYLSKAKSSYSSGKLEDARFAMQQMLMELDKKAGKELLKIFPSQLGDLTANASADQVSGSSSFTGVVTERHYGSGTRAAELQVITNSPLVAGLNSLLSIPFIASSDPNQRRIKVGNYKGITRRQSENESPTQFETQIPFGSTLLSLNTTGLSEEEVTKMVQNLPMAEIAKMVE